MIVSLSGVDGSGKTTLAQELVRMLIGAGFKTVYRHEYNYIILNYLFKIVGKKRLAGKRKSFLSPSSRKTILDKIWPYFVLFDALLLVLWLKLRERKAIVILDRYLYDQLISFEGLGVTTNFINWIYLRAPRPDFSILLSVSSELAYERKKSTHNYTIQFYEKGNKYYQRIAKQLGLPIIQTDYQLSKVFKELTTILFSNKKFRNLFVNKAANNRVIYKILNDFDLGTPNLVFIEKIYKRKIAKLQKTLRLISKLMQDINIEWLLYKSYMPFSYVPTYDIDILVKPSDRITVLAHLKEKNIPNEEEEPDKVNIRMKNYYTISIHFGVSWEGIDYVSSNTLWSNTKEVLWHGRNLKIMGFEGELLSHVAHILFELSFIRLSDALYISELIEKNINWRKILFEIEFYNWKPAFLLIIQLVKQIMQRSERGVPLPYPIPYINMIKIFSEILVNDWKRGKFTLIKSKEYVREIFRYAFWRIGARIVGRAPFGEIFDA